MTQGEAAGWESVNRCTLCDSNDIILCGESAWRCRMCGNVFISPRPMLDLIADHYACDTQYASWEKQLALRQMLWRRRLAIVRRFVSGGCLLDVGAGLGEFLAEADPYFDAVGIEISTIGVQYAVNHYRVNVKQTVLEQAGFAAATFDLITMWHVLEHLPLPGKALEECKRLLSPGGVLVIAVPNAARGTWAHAMMLPRNIAKYMLNIIGRAYYYDKLYTPVRLKHGEEIHLSYFTPSVLEHYLSNHGFDVLENALDPYPANYHTGHRVLFEVCRTIYKVLRVNLYPAFCVVARKRKQQEDK